MSTNAGPTDPDGGRRHLGKHDADRDRLGDHGIDGDPHPDSGADAVDERDSDRLGERRAINDPRDHLVEREREAFGGVKIGSAFFGWLTAVGTTVLLTALAGAVSALVGGATDSNVAEQALQDPQSAGIIGGIVLAVILFIAYYCGGYVAGRMARFNGVRQGIAVWVWAVVIAIVVAVIGVITGSQLGVMSSFPQIPDLGNLTTPGIIAALVALVVTLVAAILGGLAGMRFHRRVDRASLIDTP